ncbi:MAG: O-antigen ligase domain-containing protein, partial [Bacteroidia bacterium]|nr:O-antigen ligase domain-containing protein [Bacteroidia bacterium]
MIFKNKYLGLIGLHILIGLLVFGINVSSKVYFIVLLLYFLNSIINSSKNRRAVHVLIACSYIVGCEVFLRMTGGNFLYEVAKYLIIVFVFIGMMYDGINGRSFPYFIFLLLLFPAIFVTGATATFDTNLRTAVMFNLSGPFCLAFVALYCYDKSIHFKDVQNILLAALLPIISTTVYLFLFTPNIRDVITGTYSNYATSGGFGPNQVATSLGLGIFIVASRYFMNSPTLLMKMINLVLLGLITYRGLVTFSRGGMITAAIIIAALITVYYINSRRKGKQRIIGSLSFFIGIAILT